MRLSGVGKSPVALPLPMRLRPWLEKLLAPASTKSTLLFVFPAMMLFSTTVSVSLSP